MSPEATPRYRMVEHTADVAIEAYGTSREQLFEHAAWAVTDLLTDATLVHPLTEKIIRVSASNPEELFIRWLSELLYAYDVDRVLYSEFRFFHLSERELEVCARGEPWNEHQHPTRYVLKAVTYHDVHIAQMEGRWKVRVVFDI